MNKAFVMGNLVDDPDTRWNEYGFGVSRFAVAVSRGISKTTGKPRKSDTLEVIAHGRVADLCDKYLRKGSKVVIEGYNRGGYYKKDGVRVHTNVIEAEKVSFLPSVKRYVRIAELEIMKKYGDVLSPEMLEAIKWNNDDIRKESDTEAETAEEREEFKNDDELYERLQQVPNPEEER